MSNSQPLGIPVAVQPEPDDGAASATPSERANDPTSAAGAQSQADVAVPVIDLRNVLVIDARTLLADTDAAAALTAIAASAWNAILSGVDEAVGPEA
jgi:hypothetical protein